MSNMKLLLVDDDPLIHSTMEIALPEGWDLEAVDNEKDVPTSKPFQAAIVDMHLVPQTQGREGLNVIRRLRDQQPHMEIIAMSGDLDRELMEKGLKAGASRFLAKPLIPEEIQLTLSKIEGWWLLNQANQRANQPGAQWVGHSKASQTLKRQIANLRGEAGPILIEGESGTGKEVAAHLIHEQSEGGPFLQLNAAAIPESLFESEFFGHMKGAFTGADSHKMGLAEAAHGGDLFIDEIEALPLGAQVKLLRFLETGEVRRVGARESTHVKTRVIAATNRNLEAMVNSGEFREDLLWRLNGHKLILKPLRERPEDIEELARYFTSRDSRRKKYWSSEALEALTEHSWPGNVRELKRICEQLLVMSPLPVIRDQDVYSLTKSKGQESSTFQKVDFNKGLPDLVNNFEARVIARCLEEYNDVDNVARMLKISRSSLYKKIKDHNIEWRSG